LTERRASWDEYFMRIAKLVSERSTCLKRKEGAVIVREKRIVTTGYNGPPSGFPHCTEVGCLREELGIPEGERWEVCRGLHAVQNAIIQGALIGVSVSDSILYCTHAPCLICAKMCVQAGIRRIVMGEGWPQGLALMVLEEGGVSLEKFPLPESERA